jgi:hypothetical protein
MSSRTLLNLLLLAGLGALVALTVYEPGIEKPTTTQLTALNANDITELTLKRPDQIDIVLQRKAGGWRMERPYRAPATPFLDQNLTELLSATASADYPLAELDETLVGLSPAGAILELGKTTLRFGDVEPVHGNRYVQAGDRVYLIPDHLAVYTSVEAIELLSPALLPVDSRITGIELPALSVTNTGDDATGMKTPARTLRRVEGLWTLREHSEQTRQATPVTRSESSSKPVTQAMPALSGDDLIRWLDEWRYAQAIDIAALPHDQPSTENPAGDRIEIQFQGQDPIRFLVIATTPDLVLARADAGLSYRFSAEQAQRLLYPPNAGIDGHKPPQTPAP